MFYVYILKDNDIPFYVGKGTKNRMYEHSLQAKRSNKSTHLLNKIRKMFSEGRSIQYEKVFFSEDAREALDKEIELIALYGRIDKNTGILVNGTDGGDGVVGYVYTEEHKRKISNALKTAIKEGRLIPAGKKCVRDIKYRDNMSKAMRTYYDTNPDADKTREKISKQRKKLLVDGKRVLSTESRTKMISSPTRVWTKEMSEKLSASMKRSWEDKHKTCKDKL
jgi:hypothetical protein